MNTTTIREHDLLLRRTNWLITPPSQINPKRLITDYMAEPRVYPTESKFPARENEQLSAEIFFQVSQTVYETGVLVITCLGLPTVLYDLSTEGLSVTGTGAAVVKTQVSQNQNTGGLQAILNPSGNPLIMLLKAGQDYKVKFKCTAKIGEAKWRREEDRFSRFFGALCLSWEFVEDLCYVWKVLSLSWESVEDESVPAVEKNPSRSGGMDLGSVVGLSEFGTAGFRISHLICFDVGLVREAVRNVDLGQRSNVVFLERVSHTRERLQKLRDLVGSQRRQVVPTSPPSPASVFLVALSCVPRRFSAP